MRPPVPHAGLPLPLVATVAASIAGNGRPLCSGCLQVAAMGRSPGTLMHMTIEEMLRSSEVRTAGNGVVYAVVEPGEADVRSLEQMVEAVPRSLVPRIGRTACYFVPWLLKEKRDVVIETAAEAPEDGEQKALCHHLDLKEQGNLLVISLQFYQHDSYGLAMEFYDKIAYVASLQPETRDDFYRLLERQLRDEHGGEMTPEAFAWRKELLQQRHRGDAAEEAETNYRRATETDALGVYMASLFTDVFYEDLFDDGEETSTPLSPDHFYDRIRTAERLYPANRGYSLQVVRQRARRSSGSR